MINYRTSSQAISFPSKPELPEGLYMLPIYFDEVKHQEGVQPCYRVGGIAVTPEVVRGLEKAVDELSEECFEASTLSKDTGFHAKEIFHGN